jgi:hypothetical protein
MTIVTGHSIKYLGRWADLRLPIPRWLPLIYKHWKPSPIACCHRQLNALTHFYATGGELGLHLRRSSIAARFTDFYCDLVPKHDAFNRGFNRLTPFKAINDLVVQAASDAFAIPKIVYRPVKVVRTKVLSLEWAIVRLLSDANSRRGVWCELY